ALEEGAIFDGDASSDDVAGQRAVATDIHAVAGGEVAANFAQHDDLAGVDVGGDDAVAADGNAVAGQIDRTLDAAVNVERLGAGYFTFDHERLADSGLIGGSGGHRTRRSRIGSGHSRGTRSGNCWALRLAGARGSLRLIRRLPHGGKRFLSWLGLGVTSRTF